MAKSMKFTVLMSVYATLRANFLVECLNSLADQTLSPSQLVIVQDGPIPHELQQILESFESKLPLERIELNFNMGLGKALNEGLKACKYDIVARMDADDIAMLNRFELQIHFLENNKEVMILGSQALKIDSKGRIKEKMVVPLNNEDILNLIWTNPVIHPTICFRKSKILELGSYDSNLKRRQDYDLWLRCAKAGLKFSNLPEALLFYREDDSSSYSKKVKQAWDQAIIGFKGVRGLNFGLKAYLGVFVPVILVLFPKSVRSWLLPLKRKLDPRSKEWINE